MLTKGQLLRILTWNCGGAFRKKFHLLEQFNADVLVIQECEDPKAVGGAYLKWASDYLWIGGRGKGLGVFCRTDLELEPLGWSSDRFSHFLPCRVGRSHDLLAVWTKRDQLGRLDYIGQLWGYLQDHHEKLLGDSVIVCGDLNSNAIWDKPRRVWNHSEVVSALDRMGVVSAYHWAFNEMQGRETRPTFFMYRKTDRVYHIDYIFCSKTLLNEEESDVTVGLPEEWLTWSDHVPVAATLLG